jgi:predicted nucleic-acid-binding protein
MIALDTNILLRLITRDDAAQVARVTRFLEEVRGQTLLVTDLVLAEVVWTLLRLYRWPPAAVAETVRTLLGKPDVEFEDRDRVAAALKAFSAGADFVDQLIVETARTQGCSQLATFDAELVQRHPGFVVQPK